MANAFSDKNYAKGYQNDLANRWNSNIGNTAEQTKIRNEMNRVANVSGVGVNISGDGGRAWLPGVQVNGKSVTGGDQEIPQYPDSGGKGNRGKSGLSGSQVRTMSYEDALKQAGQQLDPIRTMARNSAGVVNQQQLDILRQKLASEGNLNDGEYGNALVNMSQQHQENLNNMDSSYGSQLAALAQSIQAKGTAQAQQEFQNEFARWQAENQLKQQQYSNQENARQFDMSYSSGLLPYFMMTEAQRQGLPLEWAQVVGEVPGQLPGQNGANGAGGYDPAKLMAIVEAYLNNK